SHARQADVPLYRVDLRAWNTDPSHRHDVTVHQTVTPDQAVAHFSWVRDDETMRRKFGWSGHAAEYSQPVVYRRWIRRQRHPWATAITSPLRRRDWYRISGMGEPSGDAR